MGVWGWSCPWVLVPKDVGLVLPLGMSPKRHGGMTCPWVMSQNSHYYIDRVSCGALIFDIYILVGVNSLSVMKGWTMKSKDETNKHTCST